MSEHLMTADEVAERLSVPASWVYRAAREGDLPSVRCGRYRRFDEGNVDRWIAGQKAAPTLERAGSRVGEEPPPVAAQR